MIQEHVDSTGSPFGNEILADWETYLPKFKKIIPHDYQAMMVAIGKFEETGTTHEQAQMEAFYALQK